MLINLTKYYNHKLLCANFNEPNIVKNENCGVDGNYLLLSEFCKIFKLNDKLYLENNYDNITCDEQFIPIYLSGNKVEIIGFSEWGDYEEEIIFETTNGILKKTIFFYEWHVVPNMRWQKDIIYSACDVIGRLKTNYNENISIYKYSINFISENYIKHIILPKNPAIHIFLVNIY